MINNNLLATTSWRNYLLPRNKRVKNFLKQRGADVLWQVCQNIHEAYRDKRSEVVILIHPNLSHAILIPQKDYIEVLEVGLKYFTKQENYEKCIKINAIKIDIKEKRELGKPIYDKIKRDIL
jgi:hypothetical protein